RGRAVPPRALPSLTSGLSALMPGGDGDDRELHDRGAVPVNLLAPIVSERCALVVLTPALIATMRGEDDGAAPFRWPAWWPDDADRVHLRIWAERARASEAHIAWGPRAIVDAQGHMVGHAGFHLPPRSIDDALS